MPETCKVGFKEESFRTLMKNVAKVTMLFCAFRCRSDSWPCSQDKDVIKKLEKTREERKVDFAKAAL